VITVLFHITLKPGREDEWQEMLTSLYQTTHAQDDGCISYSFYRQVDAPRNYVLHEQWRDSDALTAHIYRLQRLIGPPAEGSRLPAAFLDLFERTEAFRYDVVT
jgi:quinol monooxygenase YgiN